MGCVASIPNNVRGNRRRLQSVGELAVFFPGLRIPRAIDFFQPLGDSLPKSLVDRLSSLRTRIVAKAAQGAALAVKPKRKMSTSNGTSTFSDILQALEDYLPVLLGLAKNGQLKDKVEFIWVNQEDDEETTIGNVWYEVLSVLHLMAMLCLAEANCLLLHRTSGDDYQPSVSEESRRRSIDVLMKAAGYLDCAIHHVLPQISIEIRRNLPIDLSERKLSTLCLQALGQGVDIQLGIAVDSPKATLAVKRRIACEMVKYWHQAEECILKVSFTSGWGEKHRLFIKWKYVEAKAAAYYYHGLVLDEGNTEKSHTVAVAALQAAEEFLKLSKRACEDFHLAAPTSRSPPPWGSIKSLSEKIAKDASSKVRINQDHCSHERIIQCAPTLPDFALALKPDDYQLPPLDSCWN
ncbi:hypothetical protein AXF42_Ash014695 [Apostasia shenzhenica]|uniref:BRO1 domain-containing protein n=1 Tax=Apostasia shenzhenica TaxID=1088818 RepID=A0A2I0AKD6_9ASPA|nr:hypothetical protein AXF42_Ash014695 [Apostasia shenzhenica]